MQRGDDVKAEVLSALQQLALESRTDTDGEKTAEFLRNYYEGSAPADLADVDPLGPVRRGARTSRARESPAAGRGRGAGRCSPV